MLYRSKLLAGHAKRDVLFSGRHRGRTQTNYNLLLQIGRLISPYNGLKGWYDIHLPYGSTAGIFRKACLSLFLALFCLIAAAQKRPNIILILADDLGYETLGCNGNDDKMTPKLDSLARTGMRFENCHATPLCTPSRNQLMTGKYNHRNYIGFGLLDPKETSFGTLMKAQGYKTCIAGKWQLYGNAKQRELAGGKGGTLPQNAGFDDYCLWQVDDLGSRYANPTVYTAPGVSTKINKGYGPDVFVKHIEKFMEHNADAPFFVYYPMVLTHDPFVPTPWSKRPVGEDEHNSYFKDMVKYMDYLVGRIADKTKQLKIDDNTVIIFIGDNGTSPKITSNFKGSQFAGGKGLTTQRGTHVPMIVNGAAVGKKGSVNKSLIDFTDFLPTLLDLSGAPKPDSLLLDGMSFLPQLKGQEATGREWIFCAYDPRWGQAKARTFLYDTTWKVYKTGEVYDLSKDPDEKTALDRQRLTAAQKKKTEHFEKAMKNILAK